MNTINKLKGIFSVKTSATLAVVLFVGLGLVLFAAPRQSTVSRADGCSVFTSPVFNPFPVTWENNPGYGCNDFAVIAGGVHGSGAWSDNVQANAGDTITLRVYAHNGAALNSGATMHGAQYNVNFDSSEGSSHTVSATLSASNAASKSGSINIQTPAGSRLELVSGNLHQDLGVNGDIEPCFEHSASYFITLRVVAPVVTQPASGTISANLGLCLANGEMSGTINWSTSNVANAEVLIKDETTGYTNTWNGTTGNNSVDWLTPGENYSFTLYNTSNGKTQLDKAYLNVPQNACGTTPTVTPQASGNIDFTISNNRVGTLCQLYGTVTWNTSNVNNVKVYVKNNGSETLFGAYDTLSQTVDWFTPGEQYQFILRGDGGFTKQTAIKTAPALNCGTVAGAQPTGAIDFTISNSRVGTLCQLYGTVTWTSKDVANVKVYVKNNGTERLFGAEEDYNATVDWFTPGEQYQFILRGDGGFTKQTAIKTAPALNCGTVAGAQPSGAIDFTISNSRVGTLCQLYGTVTWTSKDVANVKVYVKNNGVERLFGAEENYNATVDWFTPGEQYQFILRGDGGFTKQTAIKTAPALNCAAAQTPAPVQSFTATATATATASANASCPAGASASASASATASATASSNVSQADAQNKAQTQAQSLAQAQAQANAQASASANCPNAPQNYNANATASADGFASYTCPSGVTVTATATATASASANSTVSLSDAQYKALGQAQDSARAQANANAAVIVKTKCPTVVATPTPTPTPIVINTGDCNNSNNSCNTNTNTNNSTNNNSTNSSNQNNNSNINGNNNVVTQTNQNCVNNSCNTVYLSSAGTVIPANQFSQLSITKMVSVNGSGYQNSVTANNGQTVQFQIVVTNTGNAVANNVRLTDNLPYGLTFVNGSLSGGYNNNIYNNNNLSNINLGNISAGQNVTITFSATVNNQSGSIQNTATASSDNAGSVQASAWVFVNTGSVQGGSVNLSYTKKAYNDTKGSDATVVTASRENYITYTLTVNNSGNTPANSFIITDDLSQVLPYADIVDNGGGSLSGNVISFPGLTVPAGGSVSRSFKVRVKYALADNLSYTMTNTYGNVVTIKINTPQVLGAFVAPHTGADTMGIVFSTILTAGAVVMKKRKDLLKLIFT
jgi:uncharacterized repeat protein (TIGR01451 family)